MSDQLLPHPLAALRAELWLTGEQYLDRLATCTSPSATAGWPRAGREVSRWENDVNSPEIPAPLLCRPVG
jgi:hypothetical protein